MDEELGGLTEDDFVIPPVKYEYLDHTADVHSHENLVRAERIIKKSSIWWLGQGLDSESSTPGHGTHSVEVPLSGALTTGSLDLFPDADGLHAWGNTLKEAFEQCGMAMFAYMTEMPYVQIKEVHTIEANADDLMGLLYHFLDELLYLFSVEPFLICKKLVITEFNMQEFRIVCKCYGEEFQLGKHPQGTEVKAITYSAMQIIDEPKDNKYEVFVIIDI